MKNWKEFRHRRVFFLVALFGSGPLLALTSVVFERFRISIPFFFVLMAIVISATVILYLRYRSWECPECGYPFVRSLWFMPSRRCRKCKVLFVEHLE